MERLVPAAVALILPLFFGLIRWLQRRSTALLSEQYDVDELNRRYSGHDRWEYLLFVFVGLPIWVGAGAMGYWVFWKVAVANYRRQHNVVFEIPQSIGWFVLPSAVIGVIVFGASVWLIWCMIFGNNLREWLIYKRLKSGFNAVRLNLWIWGLISIFVIISLLLGFDEYTVATPTALIVNEPWTLGETSYDYDQVQSILQDFFVAGKPARRTPRFWILFTNGSQWESQGPVKDINPGSIQLHQQLVEYVSKQSGKPIRVLGD